jgi:hypothetical protein
VLLKSNAKCATDLVEQLGLGQNLLDRFWSSPEIPQHRCEVAMLRRSILLSLFFAIAFPAVPVFAQAQAKWFVLRNHEVGNCWTAVLIRIDGQYINTFEQKAGGPYDTEEEALARQNALENQGTCSKNGRQ